MADSDFPTILTPEEVANRLQVDVTDIVAECEAGRLRGVRVGEKWRITLAALLTFLGGVTGSGSVANPVVIWTPCEPFKFKWPDGTVEKYAEAFEADVQIGGEKRHFVIGYAYRDAAGMKRRRVVVFMGHIPQIVPMVEFTGTNDFEDSKMVVSVVKGRDNHHVKSVDQLPPEYSGIPTIIYSDVVIGPYAPRSVAVYVKDSDRDIMARHAIIRGGFKGML